jgi:Gram-negative bacterial TonB protein C-terminal
VKKTLLLLSALALVWAVKAVNADGGTPPDVLYASVFHSQGLNFSQVKPWHLKAHYTVLKAGKMVSGIFEEWWVAPHTYRLSYSRKGFVQTDYASDAGLFRVGEQQWPVGDEGLIHQEIAQPLPVMPDAKEAQLRMAAYDGNQSLRCVEVAYNPGAENAAKPSDPVYCMDRGRPVLRMTALHGMQNLTTYNRITQFQGHYVAGDIQNTWFNRTLLTLTVDSLESLTVVDAVMFAPPAGATLLSKDKVILPSGALTALKLFPPTYPSLAKQIRSDGEVNVHVTIDRLGRVVKVSGATGPPLLRQPAIDAVSHWIFRPFLFCGDPVEVDAEVPIGFSLN